MPPRLNEKLLDPAMDVDTVAVLVFPDPPGVGVGVIVKLAGNVAATPLAFVYVSVKVKLVFDAGVPTNSFVPLIVPEAAGVCVLSSLPM